MTSDGPPRTTGSHSPGPGAPGLELIEGDLAAARITEALDRVRSTVPYLRAEVGNLGPQVPVGSGPQDGEWTSCDELLAHPHWLEAVVLATGRRLGTEDPVVAASLFVQNYSYRVMALAIACFTTSGVVPGSSASAMSIALVNGRPSIVAYALPTALVIDREPPDIASALNEPAILAGAFEFLISMGVHDHIGLLIDSVRARIRAGARLLWGNVAASSAVAFRTMEGCLGQWVQPLGERFFDYCPVELKGLGSFLALELAGRRGWYWERTNCCLYDRLPGNIRCADCSRTPTEERRSAYLASLRGS